MYPRTELTGLVYRIRENVGTQQPLLWGGVMYLSTQSLLLDSSLLCSNSQNIQELICQANTLVIYINQPQLGLVFLYYLHTCLITGTRRYQIPHRVTIKHGIIIQSVISNKVAKPFLINIKAIKYITNNFYIVNTRVTAELLQKGNQIVNYTLFPV